MKPKRCVCQGVVKVAMVQDVAGNVDVRTEQNVITSVVPVPAPLAGVASTVRK